MRRTIQAECFSCHDKLSMNVMPRAVVNGSDVLLCRSCNHHFERHGYTPLPIIFPPKSIHCDQCKRLYTKVDIYQVQGRNLCLLCESLVIRKSKPRSRPARLSFSWKTVVLGGVMILCMMGITKVEEFDEMFDPLHTTPEEVSDYVQTVTNPLNELNNQLMTDLGIAGGSIGEEKAIAYEEQLHRISLHVASEEEELVDLVQEEKNKIELLKEMIATARASDPVKRNEDINALVGQLEQIHEQGNRILTGLFDEKEIEYEHKEGEAMHYYYTKGDEVN
ncbi:MAG: hypothetical protein ACI33P_10100 [Lysinibacillus sp.]